jgi:hypothetical protein
VRLWDGNQWLTLAWIEDGVLGWYEDADPTFSVRGDLAAAAWADTFIALELLLLYRSAFSNGESCGRVRLQYELCRLIGAATAEP